MKNQKTDLNKIKDVTKMFLFSPIMETELSPMIVNHPVYSSYFFVVDGELLNLSTPSAFAAANHQYEEIIDRAPSIWHCFNLIRRPYALTYLKCCKKFLSIEDFSKMLGQAWTSEEFPNRDIDVPVSLSEEWFNLADRKALMSDDELELFNSLPEIFHVYRGVHDPDDEGMSWTLSEKVACWFANRFDTDGYILHSVANKSDVLAYFSRAAEDEIVIPSSCLMFREVMQY